MWHKLWLNTTTRLHSDRIFGNTMMRKNIHVPSEDISRESGLSLVWLWKTDVRVVATSQTQTTQLHNLLSRNLKSLLLLQTPR